MISQPLGGVQQDAQLGVLLHHDQRVDAQLAAVQDLTMTTAVERGLDGGKGMEGRGARGLGGEGGGGKGQRQSSGPRALAALCG
jgi:hypothetical protein